MALDGVCALVVPRISQLSVLTFCLALAACTASNKATNQSPSVVSSPPTVISTSPSVVGFDSPSTITLTGTGLRAGLTVQVGDSPCDDVRLISDSQLTCLVRPVSAPGTVRVAVVNSDRQMASFTGFELKDLTRPSVSFLSRTAQLVNVSSVNFTFSAQDNWTRQPSMSCSLDNQVPSDCSSGLIAYSNLMDGPHTLALIATDAAGNSSDPLSYSWVQDTTPPRLALVSPSENSTSGGQLTLQGHCEDTGRAVIVSGDVANEPVSAECHDGQFSKDIVLSVGDGIKSVNLSQLDQANNGASLSRTLYRDTTPPVVTQSAHPSPYFTNTRSATFSGSCETGLPVVIAGAVTGLVSCEHQSWSFTPADQSSDGSWDYTFTQTDAAGNRSMLIGATWVRNTVGPSISISGPAENTERQSALQVQVVCTRSSNVGPVEISGDILVSGGGASISVPCGLNSAVSQDVVFSSGDGIKTIQVAQTDAAGTRRTSSRVFVRKNTPPTVVLRSSDLGVTPSHSLAQRSISVSGQDVVSYKAVVINFGDCFSADFSQAISNPVASPFIFTPANNSSNQVCAVGVDPAGNWQTVATASTPLRIDTVVPLLAWSSPTDLSYVSHANQSGFLVSGTCTKEGTVSLNASEGGLNITASAICSSDHHWSATLDLSSLLDGPVVLTADQTDAAENHAARITLTLNKLAHLPVFLGLSLSPSAISSNGTPSVSGMTSAGATLTLYESSGASVDCTGPSIATSIADLTSGAFVLKPSSPLGADGNYLLQVKGSDAAGNSTCSTLLPYTLDTTAPILTLSAPSNTARIIPADQSYSIIWSASDAQSLANNPISISYSMDGGSSWNNLARNISNTGNFTWSNPPAASGQGQSIIKIEAVDAAGNSSAVTSLGFTILGAPVIVLSNSWSASPPNLTAESTVTIAYTSIDLLLSSNSVKIEGSSDGGSTWSALVGSDDLYRRSPSSSLPNSGTYSWLIDPLLVAGAYQVRVGVSDVLGKVGYSVSAPFAVDPNSSPPHLRFSGNLEDVTVASNQNNTTFTGGTCDSNLPTISITTSPMIGDVADAATTQCSVDGHWSYTTASQTTNGTRHYTFTQSNGQLATITAHWTRFNATPILMFVSPTPNTLVQSGVTVSGVCQAHASLQFSGPISDQTAFICSESGTFSKVLNFSSAAVGLTTVTLSETDSFNNQNSLNLSLIVPYVGVFGQPSLTQLQQEQGFSSPSLAIRVGQKLLVSSTTQNRILFYNNAPTSTGLAVPDLYLGPAPGGVDETVYGAARAASLNQPTGMASDGTRLVVADTSNNRVLIWNQLPTQNRQPADVVLGQPNFTTNSSGCTSTSMSGPRGVWIDSVGSLYVADTSNHRVLVYNSIPSTSGIEPSALLGQPNLSTCTPASTTSSTSLRGPMSVFSQSGNLFVADSGNNRVLIFNLPIRSSPQAATGVLGQSSLTGNSAPVPPTASSLSAPSYIAGDGTRIAVSDLRNNRILIWNQFTPSPSPSANVVLGQASFTTSAINYGGLSPSSINTDRMVNVNGGGTGSAGLFYDGISLYFADALNHRVLAWNGIPTSNLAPAGIVIGQPNAYSAFAGGVSGPSAVTYPNQLAVADGKLIAASAIGSNGARYFQDNRVLIWNSVPVPTSPVTLFDLPAKVLGQPDFTTNQPNFFSSASPVSNPTLNNAVSAQGMSGPMGVAWDGNQLYVSDWGNQRILVYSGVPGTSGAMPSGVIGQADLITGGSSSTAANRLNYAGQLTAVPASGGSPAKLFVPDMNNNRVLIFFNPPASPAPNYAASVVLGQVDFNRNVSNASLSPVTGSPISALPNAYNLNGPRAVGTDGTHLVVSDSGNHRVLIWNSMPTGVCPAANPFCYPADLVLGQPDFNSNLRNSGSAVSAHSLNQPRGVWTDGARLVVADSGNSRVLVWNQFPTAINQDADQVFGQPDFLSNSVNRGGPPAFDSLSSPFSAIIINDVIYISDIYNNRILALSHSVGATTIH